MRRKLNLQTGEWDCVIKGSCALTKASGEGGSSAVVSNGLVCELFQPPATDVFKRSSGEDTVAFGH